MILFSFTNPTGSALHQAICLHRMLILQLKSQKFKVLYDWNTEISLCTWSIHTMYSSCSQSQYTRPEMSLYLQHFNSSCWVLTTRKTVIHNKLWISVLPIHAFCDGRLYIWVFVGGVSQKYYGSQNFATIISVTDIYLVTASGIPHLHKNEWGWIFRQKYLIYLPMTFSLGTNSQSIQTKYKINCKKNHLEQRSSTHSSKGLHSGSLILTNQIAETHFFILKKVIYLLVCLASSYAAHFLNGYGWLRKILQKQ